MCIRDRYNEEDIGRIYETGRGGVRVRARYEYQKDGNMIEVTQIPPTTTIEAIMDKIAELVKSGRVKAVSYTHLDVYKRQACQRPHCP